MMAGLMSCLVLVHIPIWIGATHDYVKSRVCFQAHKYCCFADDRNKHVCNHATSERCQCAFTQPRGIYFITFYFTQILIFLLLRLLWWPSIIGMSNGPIHATDGPFSQKNGPMQNICRYKSPICVGKSINQWWLMSNNRTKRLEYRVTSVLQCLRI